jgi:hypothetical protein
MGKTPPIRFPEPARVHAPSGAPHADAAFSLVVGGPLYQLYLRTRLVCPPLERVVRRVIAIPLFCWVPLLLLSALQGHLTAGVNVPFLYDPEVHARFLLALPLLIGAEVVVHQRMRLVVEQFVERGIIVPEDRARFQGLINSGMRLRNSVAFELILLVFVFTAGHWIWNKNISLSVSTWYALHEGGRPGFTAAGYWYAFFCLPFFRFVLYRWYFRIFVWYRFVWQVRRMPLHFNLYHPDRVGGLGFLSNSALAIIPISVAQTIAFAGLIFSRILYAGTTLPAFKMEIAGWVVFMLLLAVAPLGFFSFQLEHAGRQARSEFGALASHYVDDFRRKWMASGPPAGEQLLGSSDIQSLADMGNSYSIVSEMRLFPITKQTLIRLVIMIVLPLLPLTLTMFPLDEMISRLFKFMF